MFLLLALPSNTLSNDRGVKPSGTPSLIEHVTFAFLPSFPFFSAGTPSAVRERLLRTPTELLSHVSTEPTPGECTISVVTSRAPTTFANIQGTPIIMRISSIESEEEASTHHTPLKSGTTGTSSFIADTCGEAGELAGEGELGVEAVEEERRNEEAEAGR